MHAELSGGVRGSGDHSTLVGAAADHDRLAFERRVEELFHGDKEGVHIDVEVDPRGFLQRVRDGASLR
jgi:hypothetical protein